MRQNLLRPLFFSWSRLALAAFETQIKSPLGEWQNESVCEILVILFENKCNNVWHLSSFSNAYMFGIESGQISKDGFSFQRLEFKKIHEIIANGS